MVAAARRSGFPLRGVFHAAGVLDDGLFAEQTPERWETVLSPKVAGALNLHSATAGEPLDHFVLFSSVASLVGGAGQASYAVANAFLGALAEQRERDGLPALAVDWGAWAGAGMAARIGERERKKLQDSGLYFLDPAKAAEWLETLLAARATPRALVAAIDWQRIAATARTVPPLLEGLVSRPAAAKPDDAPRTAAAPEAAAAAGNDDGLPRSRAELAIAQIWKKLLKVDQVSVHDTFFDLGGDSLLSAEFVTLFERETGIRVDPQDVIVQTLQQLAAACEPKFRTEEPAPLKPSLVGRLMQQIRRSVS